MIVVCTAWAACVATICVSRDCSAWLCIFNALIVAICACASSGAILGTCFCACVNASAWFFANTSAWFFFAFSWTNSSWIARFTCICVVRTTSSKNICIASPCVTIDVIIDLIFCDLSGVYSITPIPSPNVSNISARDNCVAFCDCCDCISCLCASIVASACFLNISFNASDNSWYITRVSLFFCRDNSLLPVEEIDEASSSEDFFSRSSIAIAVCIFRITSIWLSSAVFANVSASNAFDFVFKLLEKLSIFLP